MTRVSSLPLFGLLAVLLLGCHGRGSGRIELRFWALGREGEVVQQLVPQFERENPEIRVVVQQIPWTAAHEKLLTAFVGDSMPDLAQIGNTWIPEQEVLGAIEALDGLAERSDVVRREAYFPGIWDTNVIGGKLYGVPWYVDTRVLFYRTDILAQAGVTAPPKSWEAWRDAMQRVKKLVGPERFAILLPVDEWAQPVVLAMQSHSTLLRDGNRYGAFETPEFKRALAFYVGLFRDGLAPALGMNQVANAYQQFAEGYFASYITGPWNLGEFRRRLPLEVQDKWTTAPLPAMLESEWPGASIAGGSSLVVFAASKHKEAAFKLIEFLARPEQQGAFCALTGDLPARREAWDEPTLALDPRTHAFLLQLDHARPVPKIPEWEQVAQRLAEVAELALMGRVTIEQAVKTLDHDVDHMLEKRRFILDQVRREPQ
jgi:multiple sugar transport system substrate-binding protein